MAFVFKGLTKMVHLQDLWLNENQISNLEGLDNCTKLK